MRVGYDCNPIVNTHFDRGIGRSTAELLRALVSLGPDVTYLLYHAGTGRRERLPAGPRLIARPLLAPGLLRACSVDGLQVLHINDYFFPLYETATLPHFRVPVVVTVRDLIPLLLPNGRARRRQAFLQRQLESLSRVAAMIIAISETTKNDLVRLLAVDPRRVEVVYHGVDHSRFHTRHVPERVLAVRAGYDLYRPYILCVGAFQPRKNQEKLAAAYRQLPAGLRANHDLVLVGPDRPPPGLIQLAAAPPPGRIVLLGTVPDSELPLLYVGARVFALPTMYEGFGRPLVEAMASGVPVLTSRVSCIPEVVGDAALLVDPGAVDDITRGLKQLLSDDGLRRDLTKRGLDRARRFDWRLAARAVLNVYARVARR